MADLPKPDRIIVNTTLATMPETAEGGNAYGLIEDGAVAIAGDTIVWAGPRGDLPAADGAETVDAGGRIATPGLIDCHTHIVYGGNRAGEFEERLNGVAYAEIARRGGGIAATMTATRAESEYELLASAERRLAHLRAEGVTTIEIKSGYGLDTETECKMLRTARAIGEAQDIDVETSFLGAHALPPEFNDDADGFIDLVAGDMLDQVAKDGLADAVDGFCETIAFSPEQMARVFEAAVAHGLPVKLHAEQLSNLGGTAMAAGFGAISCDHLEYLDDQGVAAMADAGTVAVLLPGAFYYLRETQEPPVEALRGAGVPIAVATDLNPGSSPVHSLLAAMNMACVLWRLTPAEALRGATVNAARALGLDDRGRIAAGLRADLAFWDIAGPGELAYPLGANPLAAVFKNGALVRGALDCQGEGGR